MIECPFKVGDEIQEVSPGSWRAKVTAVHEKGFDYEYDEIKALIPRWGWSMKGGTCYPEGFSCWKLVSD